MNHFVGGEGDHEARREASVRLCRAASWLRHASAALPDLRSRTPDRREASIANVDACRHLAFVFIGETAEFGYRSADFQKREARRRTSQLDLSRLRGVLERIGYGNKLLALEITYGGGACGPVWYSDVYGFDYETVVDEAAELETPAFVVAASAANS